MRTGLDQCAGPMTRFRDGLLDRDALCHDRMTRLAVPAHKMSHLLPLGHEKVTPHRHPPGETRE